MNKFTVNASVEKLDDVLHFVNARLERKNCDPELQNQIDVAVEEIFVNIAHYAYKLSVTGKATITIAIAENVVITFKDSGFPFNPLKQAAPDLDKPIMERDIGGLGVFLAKKIMDKIEYVRLGNKNVLTMTKKLAI